jgi:hypothetical protein
LIETLKAVAELDIKVTVNFTGESPGLSALYPEIP